MRVRHIFFIAMCVTMCSLHAMDYRDYASRFRHFIRQLEPYAREHLSRDKIMEYMKRIRQSLLPYALLSQDKINESLLDEADDYNADRVERLLTHGAQPNTTDENDNTPLHKAASLKEEAREEDKIDTVRVLIRWSNHISPVSKMDAPWSNHISPLNKADATPLAIAVLYSNFSIAKTLVEGGHPVDNTSFVFAALRDEPKILQMFFDHGTSFQVLYRFQAFAEMILPRSYTPLQIKDISPACLSTFIENGAYQYINTQTPYGTPLAWHIERNNIANATVLISYGADPRACGTSHKVLNTLDRILHRTQNVTPQQIAEWTQEEIERYALRLLGQRDYATLEDTINFSDSEKVDKQKVRGCVQVHGMKLYQLPFSTSNQRDLQKYINSQKSQGVNTCDALHESSLTSRRCYRSYQTQNNLHELQQHSNLSDIDIYVSRSGDENEDTFCP